MCSFDSLAIPKDYHFLLVQNVIGSFICLCYTMEENKQIIYLKGLLPTDHQDPLLYADVVFLSVCY